MPSMTLTKPVRRPKPEPVDDGRDVYDDAVDYLLAHPDELVVAWSEGGICFMDVTSPGSPLFRYLFDERQGKPGKCGCPTMVRRGGLLKDASRGAIACTPELTDAVRADSRLPGNQYEIKPTRECLEAFAHYQRECDRITGRKVPRRRA